MPEAQETSSKAKYSIGLPPWLSVLPLREQLGLYHDVTLTVDFPRELAGQFLTGELDCVLLPALDCLAFRHCRAVPGVGVCIPGGSPTDRLLLRTEPGQVRQLALDPRTGGLQALPQIVLSELFGVRPELVLYQAGQLEVDAVDAIALSGDAALVFPDPDRLGLDLGAFWHDLTRLPFVQMLFLVNRSVHHAQIRRVLAMAGQQATERREALIQTPETTAPFAPALVQTVLRSVSYTLHSIEMEGLRALLKYAAKLGLCSLNDEVMFC
jgi:predicted solute-binding protein